MKSLISQHGAMRCKRVVWAWPSLNCVAWQPNRVIQNSAKNLKGRAKAPEKDYQNADHCDGACDCVCDQAWVLIGCCSKLLLTTSSP